MTSGSALPRAVQDAIPGIVASLAPWRVNGAHQLPGPDRRPVLWLEISDEAERVAMQSQVWLSAGEHRPAARRPSDLDHRLLGCLVRRLDDVLAVM